MNYGIPEWKSTLSLYENYNLAVICSDREYAERYADLGTADILMHIPALFDSTPEETFTGWNDFITKRINVLIADVPLVYVRKYAIEFGSFCEANGILFVDAENHDLIHLYEEERRLDLNYSSQNLEELKESIDRHDIISFDIFDTLLCRRVLYPGDVFEMMIHKSGLLSGDFVEARERAERGLNNPDIYEIYAALGGKYGWNARQQERLIALELELENRLLTVRRVMKEAFQYAIDRGKQVYLLTDMYIPAKILDNWLEQRGIRGYNGLWVSCEHKMTKYSGMYDRFIEYTSAESYLHIGDNWSVDGVCAQASGMDTYLIKGIAGLFQTSCYSGMRRKCRTINDKLLLGMLAERLFNNPFVLNGRTGVLEIGTMQDVGYLFWGPVTAAFMVWFMRQIKKSKYRKIIFPSRDGFLPAILYQSYKTFFARADLPESTYVLTSRNACMLADIEDEKDIAEMLQSCPYTAIDEILQKRFLVEAGVSCDGGVAATDTTVLSHREIIQQQSVKLCEAYREYLERNGLEQHGKYVFFDLMSSGTCQMHLQNILKSEIIGYYFCREHTDNVKKEKLEIHSFLDANKKKEAQSAVRRRYLMMEFVFSSYSPSVRYIDEAGSVVFEEEKRSREDIQMMEAIQSGIIEFYELYLKLCCGSKGITKELADLLFGQIESSKIKIVKNDFYRMKIYDDWSQVYIKCMG